MDKPKFYHRNNGPHGLSDKKPVLDVRPIQKENFNPMCWHLLDYENTCQVLVDVAGEPAWINVRKSDLEY